MNLPEYRQAIHARTWGRHWSPSDMDPIVAYRRPRVNALDIVLDCALAIAIGVSIAVLVAYSI